MNIAEIAAAIGAKPQGKSKFGMGAKYKFVHCSANYLATMEEAPQGKILIGCPVCKEAYADVKAQLPAGVLGSRGIRKKQIAIARHLPRIVRGPLEGVVRQRDYLPTVWLRWTNWEKIALELVREMRPSLYDTVQALCIIALRHGGMIFHASVRELAKISGYSHETIARNLRILVKLGLLECVWPEPGFNDSKHWIGGELAREWRLTTPLWCQFFNPGINSDISDFPDSPDSTGVFIHSEGSVNLHSRPLSLNPIFGYVLPKNAGIILTVLQRNPRFLSPSALSKYLNLSKPTVIKHLKLLRELGLLNFIPRKQIIDAKEDLFKISDSASHDLDELWDNGWFDQDSGEVGTTSLAQRILVGREKREARHQRYDAEQQRHWDYCQAEKEYSALMAA